MKYEGYKIGPVIRDIRKDKGLLIEEVAAKTGISVSTLGQVEQGGRNLSMKSLYMLMEVYETDANSLLAIECTPDQFYILHISSSYPPLSRAISLSISTAASSVSY